MRRRREKRKGGTERDPCVARLALTVFLVCTAAIASLYRHLCTPRIALAGAPGASRNMHRLIIDHKTPATATESIITQFNHTPVASGTPAPAPYGSITTGWPEG